MADSPPSTVAMPPGSASTSPVVPSPTTWPSAGSAAAGDIDVFVAGGNGGNGGNADGGGIVIFDLHSVSGDMVVLDTNTVTGNAVAGAGGSDGGRSVLSTGGAGGRGGYGFGGGVEDGFAGDLVLRHSTITRNFASGGFGGTGGDGFGESRVPGGPPVAETTAASSSTGSGPRPRRRTRRSSATSPTTISTRTTIRSPSSPDRVRLGGGIDRPPHSSSQPPRRPARSRSGRRSTKLGESPERMAAHLIC